MHIFKYTDTTDYQCNQWYHCIPVLETTHGKAVRLTIGIAVDRGVAGIQISAPGGRAALQRRPEVAVGAEIRERPIGIAVAGKQRPCAKVTV